MEVGSILRYCTVLPWLGYFAFTVSLSTFLPSFIVFPSTINIERHLQSLCKQSPTLNFILLMEMQKWWAILLFADKQRHFNRHSCLGIHRALIKAFQHSGSHWAFIIVIFPAGKQASCSSNTISFLVDYIQADACSSHQHH